jgi:xanthine permease XanP
MVPEILNAFPETVKGLFSSGITTGGLVAILANLFIRIKDHKPTKHRKEKTYQN